MTYQPDYKDFDVALRFWSKVDCSEGDGCWPWIAGKTAGGYGGFSLDSQRVYAHRVAYERFFGPIPSGLHIDHLCHNAACVNPSHLEAVDQAENKRRAVARPGRLEQLWRGNRTWRGPSLMSVPYGDEHPPAPVADSRSRGPSQTSGEGPAAPPRRKRAASLAAEPKQARPSPRKGQPAPRYKKADVDRKVLDLIIDLEPVTWRELMAATGYGMWVLTESVKRLRAAGLVIPGVPGRRGFLVAVKGER